MRYLRLLHLNMFEKFVLICLLGVFFETVLCSTHDVHRIVLKTHYRKNRDRDNHKYRPDRRQIRKPITHEYNEDDWPPETMTTSHRYYNYRTNHKNESNNEYEREKSNNYTIAKSPHLLNIADIVEFTTLYSEKLPVPIIESTFENYYPSPSNNSLHLYAPNESKQQNTNFSGKVRQLRKKEAATTKNVAKGYEVYEEIIGDISPPPTPSLLLNNVQKLSLATTHFPSIPQKEEENHTKGNISYFSENNNKTYGKRIKSRRNRSGVKFE